MGDVIKGKFGARRSHCIPDWPKYRAQEPDGSGPRDMEPPPDEDDPDTNTDDVRDVPGGLGVRPFTGEDAEDVGRSPQKHDGVNPYADLFI